MDEIKISNSGIAKRAKTVETAFNARPTEYRKQFSPATVDYSMIYKRVSDYSNCKSYEDAIVWQEYLVKHLFERRAWTEKIKASERQNNLLPKHSVSKNNNESREDVQCRKLVDELDWLYYYQIPLKAQKSPENEEYIAELNAGLGKIDVIGGNEDCGTAVNIIEYKIPESNEPLLRAVVEILTYLQNLKGPAGEELLSSVSKDRHTISGGVNYDTIMPAVAVRCKAYEEAHPYAYDLIKEFGIACYTFEDNDNYKSLSKMAKNDFDAAKAKSLARYAEAEIPDLNLIL